MTCARHVARADGVDVGHAILQAWRQRQSQAAAGPVRGEHQASAIVDQVLLTGNAPQLEGNSIRWRVDVRVKLRCARMTGKPDWMRVSRIQGRVFQHA